MMHGHVIETLDHRCAFANADLAWRTQSKLSQFLQGPARRVMDDVLDQFTTASEVWSIDKLEVDLGVLYAHESIDNWAQSLATHLSEQLKQRSLTRSPSVRSVSGDVKWTNAKHSERETYAQTESSTSHADRELASFLDYLERGYLDWSRSLPGGLDVVAWCSAIIEKNGPKLLASIHAKGAQSPAASRLVANASSRSLRLLLRNEVPELARVLELRLGRLRTAPGMNDARRMWFESNWLELCLRLLGGEKELAVEDRREYTARIQQRLSTTLFEALGYAGVAVATPMPERISTRDARCPQSLHAVESARTAVVHREGGPDKDLDVVGSIQALMAPPGTACSRSLLKTLGVDETQQNVTTLHQSWSRLHSALVAAESKCCRTLPGLLREISTGHPQWIGHTLRLWALHRAIRRQWVEQLDAESLCAILEVLARTRRESLGGGNTSIGRELPSSRRIAAGHAALSLSVKVASTNELLAKPRGEALIAANAAVTSGDKMLVETNVGDATTGDEPSIENFGERQRFTQLLELTIRRIIQGGPRSSSDEESHIWQRLVAEVAELDGLTSYLETRDTIAPAEPELQSLPLPVLRAATRRVDEPDTNLENLASVRLPHSSRLASLECHASADARSDLASHSSLSGSDDAAGTNVGSQLNRPPTSSKKIGERAPEDHVTGPANARAPSVQIIERDSAEHGIGRSVQESSNHEETTAAIRARLSQARATLHAALTSGRDGDSQSLISALRLLREQAPHWLRYTLRVWGAQRLGYRTWARQYGSGIVWRLLDALDVPSSFDVAASSKNAHHDEAAGRATEFAGNPRNSEFSAKTVSDSRRTTRADSHAESSLAAMRTSVWVAQDECYVEIPRAAVSTVPNFTEIVRNVQNTGAVGNAAETSETEVQCVEDFERALSCVEHHLRTQGPRNRPFDAAQLRGELLECALQLAVQEHEWARFSDWEDFWDTVTTVLSARLQSEPRTIPTDATSVDLNAASLALNDTLRSRGVSSVHIQRQLEKAASVLQAALLEGRAIDAANLESSLQLLRSRAPRWLHYVLRGWGANRAVREQWAERWNAKIVWMLFQSLDEAASREPPAAVGALMTVNDTQREPAAFECFPSSFEQRLPQEKECFGITGAELDSARGSFAQWWLDHSTESRPVTAAPGHESQPELPDNFEHVSPMHYSYDARSALPPDTNVVVVAVTPSSDQLDPHMISKHAFVTHSESNEARDALHRAGDSLAFGVNQSVYALPRAADGQTTGASEHSASVEVEQPSFREKLASPKQPRLRETAETPPHRGPRSWQDFCSAEFASRLAAGLEPLDRLELADAMSDPRACQGWLASTSEEQRWELLSAFLPESSGVIREVSQSLQRAAMRMLAETSLNSPASLNPHEMHWRFIAKHVFLEGLDAEPAVLAHRYSLYLVPFVGGSESERDPLGLLQWVRKQLAEALANGRVDSAIAWVSESQPLSNRDDLHHAMLHALDVLPTPSEAWEASYGVTAPIDDVPEKYSDAADIGAERDPLYVGNAGLVLLAPFLERLFAHQRLTHEQKFVDIAARFRAVHLMEHLVHGHTNTCEPAWVLNKLLCGLPVATPVPRCNGLDEATSAVLDDLLRAVIQHWNALGKTSIEGLQETFLRREGRLTRAENCTPVGWHLKIEDKCFDVLLDRIPWGFSLIKLPWMEGVLNVEWH